MKFHEFDICDDILDGIEDMGFEEATPIQEKTIPVILDGHDLIACAQTGTGKTAAYLLPVLEELSYGDSESMNTLILVPTRELALQITQMLQGFAYYLNVSSVAVYGGGTADDWSIQKTALVNGVDIVVATPGRLLSFMNQNMKGFDNLKFLILDEADRMLDMGFYDDIMRIISPLPKNRQTLMYSATMPPKIRKLAENILDNPTEVNIAISKPAAGILQCAYMAYENQKLPLISHLLKDKTDLKSIIIFSSRKANVGNIVRALKKVGFIAAGIHSDLEQKEREDVLLDFRNRKTQILVATDIIARGIDIDSIDLVINYDVPNDAPDYVHRVGRTARAAQTGVGITFISDKDQDKFLKIEQLIESEIIKLPVPVEMGVSPEYKPIVKKKRKPYKKKFKKKGGGKQN
ncbi:DEAD/DEAH box helicase [Prolixibacteraceae bacterium JC049]|nr:DEAD/DEAH box helicase [Prolixibacteraceae bacterium JC049]